jgi:hypothetical protein
MGLNSEQTSKLKVLVKEKLIEIGQYIDDQLTDYVMIMVTNKKSERAMAEDLELFLGGIELATTFSAWLHTTIRNFSDASTKEATASTTSGSTHKKLSKQSSKTRTSSSANNSINLNTSISVNSNNNNNNGESDELALQIDSNEFNEDFTEESKASRLLSSSSSSSKKKLVTNTRKKKSETNEIPIVVESNPVIVTVSSTLITKSISSLVGAVINKTASSRISLSAEDEKEKKEEEAVGEPVEDDDEDFKSTKRLSSVVKVTDRKYSVPKSMQPSKSILLKAVDAANNSTKHHTTTVTTHHSHNHKHHHHQKSIADERLEQIRSKRLKENNNNNNNNSRELFSENYRRNQSNKESLFDAKRLKASNAEVHDKRMVQIEVEPERQQQEPKFKITFTGLKENTFLGLNAEISKKKRSLSEMEELSDDLVNEMDTEDQEIEMEEEEDQQQQHQQQQDGQEIDDEKSAKTAEDDFESKKKLIRCTFWPMCDKGDQCPFLHPNKQCTAFPSCQFGQLCHYLHPSCKFDGFCTRSDCPYTHVIKKPGVMGLAHKETTILNVSIKPDKVVNVDGSDLSNAAKVAGITPKITINKIQPYSLVNKADSAVATTNDNNNNKSPLKTELETSIFSSQPKPFSAHYQNSYIPRPSYNKPFYPAANQFALINRSNVLSSVLINCKYAAMCKNPICPYVHPNLPQNQFKWTATSITATTTSPPLIASGTTESQKESESTNPTAQQAQPMLLSA